MNSKADVIETTYGKVDLKRIINTGKFNIEKAMENSKFSSYSYNPDDIIPETEEYGINSFIYRR